MADWRLQIAALALAAAPLVGQSQSTELHVRFNSGQSIVPVYEGWERVPDGSFNMVFGYLNRNHVQELSIPVSAQNGFDPGPADRGQPTYFYPRENHFLFKVNVPLPQRPRPVQGAISVLWQVYRGPAKVMFEPEGYVKVVDGKVDVKATFSRPGTYMIRAWGHDGLLRAPADVTVTVDGASSSQ